MQIHCQRKKSKYVNDDLAISSGDSDEEPNEEASDESNEKPCD